MMPGNMGAGRTWAMAADQHQEGSPLTGAVELAALQPAKPASPAVPEVALANEGLVSP